MDCSICTIEDEYVINKKEGEARWVVTLNDGTVVYQDDNRPGLTEWNAWKRLRNYCYTNGVYIIKMFIQFRSHVEYMPLNAEGYYFVHSVLGMFGSTINHYYFIIGTIDGARINVNKWKTPELIVVDSEYRKFKEHDECLISKYIALSQQEKNVLQLN